jgi:hypothetical protein
MLKIMKKIYNCIYIFHKSITKKSYFGLTNMGIVFLVIILVYGLTNKFVSSENVINLFNEVLAYFLICFILFIIPYFQIISFILKKDFKNKRIDRIKFCSGKYYFIYCTKTTFILIGSIYFISKLLFNYDIFIYFISNKIFFFTVFFISFSIISIFWFSYLIIYKLLKIEKIKAKLNLYIAIASTLNLVQFYHINYFIISFGVIIASYRWINYLISENDIWKRNGT